MNTKIRLASCAALLALSVGAGCGTSTSVTTIEPHPTIIEVDPLEFAGTPACGTGEGQLQRYVATLTDITRTGDPAVALDFQLPSSSPARCAQGVAFGLVVAGHFYVARVDGYDRSDLTVLAPGAPILVDPVTQKPVAPRWTTTCGTPCPYEGGKGCPAEPEPVQAGLEPGDAYNYAVRAESELTQPMSPCWAWQNP